MLKKYFFSVLIAFIFLCTALSAHPGKVVKKFPAPHSFPTGMTFDGKNLWLADYKADMLFKLDISTGEILSQIPSPGFWPMGLAWDGKYLWNVDSKQKKIFKVDSKTGAILNTIDTPSDNPDGLVWDGSTLWISDYKKKKIMKIDLSDGTAVQTFDAPASYPQGLAFDGKYLWCADRMKDEIYMIDPNSGEVIIILKSPGPYPRGLAWDGKYIWNVDYQNDEIYQLVRRDDDLYYLEDTRKAKITFTHEVKIYGEGSLKNLNAYIAVPEDMPQQKILSKTFSPKDYSIKNDRWNQPIAVFNYKSVQSEAVIQSIMEVEAEISSIRYYIFPDRCGTLADIPKDIRKLYTADGSKYMTADPYIQDLAKKIVGEEKNPYRMARKIFDYLRNTLEYKLEGGWNVAPVVLKRGSGSCSEYTLSFIALARAAGLPARYVGSIVVRGDDASFDDVFHRWAEVYLPNYGWIPIDPSGGDKKLSRDRAMNIGNLSNRFLITTQGGGDSKYLGWYYNYNQEYETDAQIKVNIETFGEWQPLNK